LIRTRVKKTIEQELADDPYAQQVFSELLKQAIAEADALFDHPVKQYALFKTFEAKLDERTIDGMPEKLMSRPHARAYYGAICLTLGERECTDMGKEKQSQLADEVLVIERLIDQAIAEHSLNQQDVESAIRKALLPRLFSSLGMEKAKQAIDEIIQIVRVGLSRRSR
jgi:type I restriction enzyme R subunit